MPRPSVLRVDGVTVSRLADELRITPGDPMPGYRRVELLVLSPEDGKIRMVGTRLDPVTGTVIIVLDIRNNDHESAW